MLRGCVVRIVPLQGVVLQRKCGSNTVLAIQQRGCSTMLRDAISRRRCWLAVSTLI